MKIEDLVAVDWRLVVTSLMQVSGYVSLGALSLWAIAVLRAQSLLPEDEEIGEKVGTAAGIDLILALLLPGANLFACWQLVKLLCQPAPLFLQQFNQTLKDHLTTTR